ncbi:hypothetical protein [Flaviaesturariibacter terrae]
MSLSPVSLQPAAPTPSHANTPGTSSLLAAVLLSVYAAQLSRRQMRKMKRKALWMLAKAQVRSLFSRRDSGISTRTLLYIMLGILVLILAFVAPVLAIILLLAGVIYLLVTSH